MAYTNKELLIDRIKNNFEDFCCSLRGLSRRKVFDMAEHIAAVKEAFRLLTEDYDWAEEDEISFYLLFRDPLTIVADAWETREYTQDFDSVMYELSDRDDVITQYPVLEGSYADILYLGEPGDERIRFESEI
jgi:hypothetical protein